MIPITYIQECLEQKGYKLQLLPERILYVKKTGPEKTAPVYMVEIYLPFLYLKSFTDENTTNFKFPIPSNGNCLNCIIDTAESFFANESSFTY